MRLFALVLAAVSVSAVALVGCTQASSTTSKNDDVLTVYLWDTDLIQDLAPYLHEQLPDKEIQFIAGNNDTDLYNYFLEHGELPDIMTVRRFAGTETTDLQPYLMDFSSYDVVSEYSSYSLQYYKNSNGEIDWLPICGIPQTIIANKTLFDEYGLELPQSYEDYVKVCQAFHDKGIKPYSLDLAEDWSSHEMIQAGGIGELTSLDGVAWRAQAESAQGEISFDETLWKKIISESNTLLEDSYFTEDDLLVDTDSAMQLFVEGKAAMFHGSPVHLKQCQQQMGDAELVRLPYFSQTSDEGYIYMTPSLHVAFNKDLEGNQEKLQTAMDVLECMLSQEGQRIIANGSSVISFNPNVSSITDDMVGLESQIKNNQYYIRYSSQKSFDASVDAVTGLLTGKMNVDQAYEAFCKAMNSPDGASAQTVSFDNSYSLALNSKGGRNAASSILTTVRQDCGAQLAFAPYYYFTSSIYEGSCTESRADLMLANKPNASSLYLETLSGAQIKQLVEHNLSGEDGDFRPSSKYELPIASGMKVVLKEDGEGFALESILVNGSPLNDDQQYSVLLTDGVTSGLGTAAKLQPLAGNTLSSAWTGALEGGRQPAQPEDYLEVKR